MKCVRTNIFADITGGLLRFSIHHGIRFIVHEAEQKKSNKLSAYKLPALHVNVNNSCKESVAKNLEKENFWETQYQEQEKINRSSNCPGNSDTVGSHA